MGRELALVPPNWDHPKTMRRWGEEDYQPMYRQSYEDAKKEWLDGLFSWLKGERPSYFDEDDKDTEYWEYAGNPPDKEYYAPFKSEDCTWFQIWETVSEGTPVTPPFETKEELIEYLVANGDFWDAKRGHGGWSRESAVSFVMGSGWAPSGLVSNGKYVESKDIPAFIESESVSTQHEPIKTDEKD